MQKVVYYFQIFCVAPLLTFRCKGRGYPVAVLSMLLLEALAHIGKLGSVYDIFPGGEGPPESFVVSYAVTF